MIRDKFKYLIIDIIIVLILIGIVYGFYKIINFNDNNNGYNKSLTYTVIVTGVSLEFINSFSEGDIVYETTDDNVVGTIVDLYYDNKYIYAYNEMDHTYKKDVVVDKYDLYINVCSKVYDNGVNLLVNNFDIKVDKNISLRINNEYVYGFIIDIVGEDNENN